MKKLLFKENKDFIYDDGKIRKCTSNIAKMNIIEFIIVDYKHLLCEIGGAIAELKDAFDIFLGFFIMVPLHPIGVLVRAIVSVSRARREMKKYLQGRQHDK